MRSVVNGLPETVVEDQGHEKTQQEAWNGETEGLEQNKHENVVLPKAERPHHGELIRLLVDVGDHEGVHNDEAEHEHDQNFDRIDAAYHRLELRIRAHECCSWHHKLVVRPVDRAIEVPLEQSLQLT